jgi:hypothetical protein
MFTTIRHAIVRRSALALLIGILLGAVFVGPVAGRVTGAPGKASAATLYTRASSCAGLDFYPTDSSIAWHSDGDRRYNLGSPGTFRCHVDLPNGAVVKKVQFTLDDTDPFADVQQCQLNRLGLLSTSVVRQTMASIPSSAGLNGVGRLTDSTIANATVDDGHFAYWLECSLNPDSALGIFGADVVFTISATKG